MKLVVFSICFFFQYFTLPAQSDCYNLLLNRGIEEFKKEHYEQAVLKWRTAKNDCSTATPEQKKILDEWIILANAAISNLKPVEKIVYVDKPVEKIVYKDKPVEKIVYVDKPVEKIVYVDKPVEKIVYVDKPVEKIVYVDQPVEKIVYVDKPVEKIVYMDRPELFHEYGKGNGKLTIFTSFGNGGTLRVWIDGEYVGSTDKYYRNGSADCGASGTVNKIVLQGSHHIVAIDERRRWEFYKIVEEDHCYTQYLK